MKNKKYIAVTASAALVLTAVAPVAFAAKFPDTVGNSHETAIDVLSQQGVITGYPDGTFKPNRTLTRSDVVKLLGKYLVTQGYTVPSDYKTNMRFTDLTPSSQDELLQYAAVVGDANVFKGSNGKLLPADFITRENMAVVLVRAYSEIKGFDFVSYVQGQTFNKDVVDYAKAKTEARPAIEVLDYYDITGVAQYNPKNNTTRGQFAGFLYKWMSVKVPTEEALTVKSATATNATTLQVVLSDNSTHTVTLPQALEENVETNVTFPINGKSYSAKVTYAVEQFSVTSVSAVNGAQFAVKFNQKVKLNEKLTSADIAAIVMVTRVDPSGSVALAGATLSADGRTLTVSTANTTLSGRYVVKVDNVVNEQNRAVTPYDQVVNFASDATAPTIVSTTNADAKTVVVKFSEPMQAYSNGALQLKLENGTSVTGITGTLGARSTELELDLTNAQVNGQPLTPTQTVVATFTAARDVAGNVLSPNPATVTFRMSEADGVKPTVETVVQTGPKTFKVTFSERVVTPVPSDLYVARGNTLETISTVTQDVNNRNAYYVTVTNNLDGQYTIGTATNKFITDISGEKGTFVTTQSFTQDTSAPIVDSYSVVKENNKHYLKLVFNKDMELTQASTVRAIGSYMLNGYSTSFTGTVTPLAQMSTNKKEYLVELADLLNGYDASGGSYSVQLQFTNVLSSFNVNAANKSVNFVREADFNNSTLAAPTIATSVIDNTLDNNTIKLVFAGNVDGVTATNSSNYTVQGAQVTSAVVNNTARNIVWLTLADNTNTFTGERDLTIANVKAENSAVTTSQMTLPIELKENVRPTVVVARDGAQTVKLTFSEAVQGVDAASFAVTVNNQAATVNAVTMANDNKTVMLTLNTTIATSNVVRVTAGQTIANVTDAAGNLLQFDPQQFTY